MRTFLTLAPEPETALAIHRWCELCWPSLERRTPVQNLHMTVAFLGDQTPESVEKLQNIIENEIQNSAGVTEIELLLDTLGYWPDTDIMWLGSREVSEGLIRLHSKCKQAANRLGAKAGGKSYTPHITLARKLNVPPPAALVDPSFRFYAQTLELWSSVREANGARYSTLGTWPLGN